MYARVNCYEPKTAAEEQFHWQLELSHSMDFSGHVVSGLFPTLAEVLDIIETNEHYITRIC